MFKNTQAEATTHGWNPASKRLGLPLTLAFLLALAPGCGGGGSKAAAPAAEPKPALPLSYANSTCVYTKGTAIETNRPAAAPGAGTVFAVSPDLPAGLTLDPHSGCVDGTPKAGAATATYTVTATKEGRTGTAILTITIKDLPGTPEITWSHAFTTGKAGLKASTPDLGSGASYVWTLTGGTITQGGHTPTILFTAGEVGSLRATVTVTHADGQAVHGEATAKVVAAPSAAMDLPMAVPPGAGWMQARVPEAAGLTYHWTLIPGTTTARFISGNDTATVGFATGEAEGDFHLQVEVRNEAGDHSTATRTVRVAPRGTWMATAGPDVKYPPKKVTATLVGNKVLVVATGIHKLQLPGLSEPLLAALYDPATNAWARTGQPPEALNEHTATLLKDGKSVLVVGNNFKSKGRVTCYDSETQQWTALAGTRTPRGRHTATLLKDGRVLVAGGTKPGGIIEHVRDAELYDVEKGTWTDTAPLQHARHDATATLLEDGRVLVTGGRTGACGAELYNPATGLWTDAASPTGRAYVYHTATRLPDGKVLVAGGISGASTSSELYDPKSDTWTVTGNLHTGRWWHTATLLKNGKVLVAGGLTAGSGMGGTQTAELFDPASGTWTPTADLHSKRAWHDATRLEDGSVLVVFGLEADRATERYLPLKP